MRDGLSVNSSSEIDSALLEHARLGLKRIHTITSPCDEKRQVTLNGSNKTEVEVASSNPETDVKKAKKTTSPATNKEKKIVYITIKKPVEKSIFYQHSKQGMKYWYEEQKPKSYTAKIPMGKKGTLLGLVDAPYK